MALLQISEPGMSTEPHQHRLAVGIDLGSGEGGRFRKVPVL